MASDGYRRGYVSFALFLYPLYTEYIGGIKFLPFPCVCVCLNVFFIKDFSGNAVPNNLKFGTHIGYDKLYCVLKNQPHMAY